MKIVWRWPKILGCTKTFAWQFKFFWCSGWQDIVFISYSVSTLTSCDPLKHSSRDKRNLAGTFRQPSRGMPVVLVTRRHYANVDTTNPQPARSQPPKPSRHHADTMFTLEPRSGQTVIPQHWWKTTENWDSVWLGFLWLYEKRLPRFLSFSLLLCRVAKLDRIHNYHPSPSHMARNQQLEWSTNSLQPCRKGEASSESPLFATRFLDRTIGNWNSQYSANLLQCLTTTVLHPQVLGN